MNAPDEQEAKLIVVRCQQCGDTFPTSEERARCPSCGSEDVREAHEPLL